MTNGLLDNLIAFFPGNEASGNLIDAHSNGLNLTDMNTVTNNTGLVYATARQYTAANSEFHTRGVGVDDALFSTGDIDYTVAGWARWDSLLLSLVAGKTYNATGHVEYQLYYSASASAFRFGVSDAAGIIGLADGGAASINTWYLLVGWHDSVAHTVNIQVNNGTVASVSTGAARPIDTDAPFSVGGRESNDHAFTAGMNGRIGPVMFWKSAAGGGGVLSSAQRTALYNGGAGLTYAAFDSEAVAGKPYFAYSQQ
jgi:hypothetical protein